MPGFGFESDFGDVDSDSLCCAVLVMLSEAFTAGGFRVTGFATDESSFALVVENLVVEDLVVEDSVAEERLPELFVVAAASTWGLGGVTAVAAEAWPG